MVRDERHGGYGDTSGIPSLAPEPERGAAAVAALTAVLEVQREAALQPIGRDRARADDGASSRTPRPHAAEPRPGPSETPMRRRRR